MSEQVHPSPTDAEWNDWATFANQVSDALRDVDLRPPLLFSQRTAIAEHLWGLGYRPTRGQVAAMILRHHEARAQVASAEPAQWEREYLAAANPAPEETA